MNNFDDVAMAIAVDYIGHDTTKLLEVAGWKFIVVPTARQTGRAG